MARRETAPAVGRTASAATGKAKEAGRSMSIDGRGVQSVEVGGRILSALVRAGRPLMLRELASRAVHRLSEFGEAGSLFDLEKDPKELNNVAAQHPDICEQMKAKLQEIRQRPETKADRADLLPLDD